MILASGPASSSIQNTPTGRARTRQPGERGLLHDHEGVERVAVLAQGVRRRSRSRPGTRWPRTAGGRARSRPVSWSISYLLRLPAGDLHDDGTNSTASAMRPAWQVGPAGRRPDACRAGRVRPRRVDAMEFRRITNLPPYVFTIIDGLKVEARRAGVGRRRPGLRQPRPAVAGRSPWRSWPRPPTTPATTATRRAGASRSSARRSPTSTCAASASPSTPRREVISTIGAKEGFSHLMWVLLQPGDAALVPSPSYPIHIWGPHLAGADVREIPIGTDTRLLREHPGGLRVLVAQAPGDRAVVPAQPHHRVRRPRLLPAGGRLRPREERGRRPRQRLRRARLRRLRAAVASSRPRGPRSARSSCTR